MGTSPLLAHHLKDVASSWNRISHHLKDQFAKVGLGVEDSKQIGELLLTMSEQYQN